LLLKLRMPPRGADGRALWESVASLPLETSERRALERVKEERRRLETDRRLIHRIDLGAGSRRSHGKRAEVTVGHLARKASVSVTWGRLLFTISRAAGSSGILELGSCVGISAAYLQAALDLNGGGCLVTLEGDPMLCSVARDTLQSVSQNPGLVIEGRFAETLPSALENHRPFDLVFIDGHHDPGAVKTYLTMILPRLSPRAVVILDDVQPLVGAVRPAWRAMVRDARTSWSVDLIRMGVFGLESAQ